ncbi:ABC transporter permease [Paraclostridium sordellii]|uniref:ABC transporter oligopeptide-family permease n=1 Tax=Paraclostridium sordellii TaxID=1505 RepID=A0A0C7R3C9_PARSO|nr:ABC transporter permease [Paeniclostridium sordellii]CEO07943.1 ABC transporter oligopeptide-family permease [[Clostridium] sordellii] [Paeniclostridium sordellii]CEP87043.1 ABC transporter oligopeptide-family permease [[Clostridium] sordellii] [Paeniclostridium sordellii]CEP95380.1 ABC transporter oligopeptide-family permease [[Clostridium] sordellii] [Paeniclostridium sordellii]CEP99280.1 ABC transporter oligopeptide-family permease [[Clostridium] sordellii] [Paeniclostridium sordellii]CE
MIKKLIKDIKKDKSLSFALMILSIIIFMVILSFTLNIDPNIIDTSQKLNSPSVKHIFGTDELGRDYLARALYGGRISLSVGIVAMIISITIGTMIGVTSGYIGGKIDNFIMRIIDILMSIPSFLVLIVINSFLRPSVSIIIIVIGLLSWMDVARVVRGETIKIKQNEYCLAAKALGIKNRNIVIRHIIPNLKEVILVAGSLNIASAILTESALSFLGLGVQLPLASWGNMLQDAQKYMFDRLYLAVFPGILIFLTVMSLTIISKKLSGNNELN